MRVTLSANTTKQHLPLLQILLYTDPTSAFGTFQGVENICFHIVKLGLPLGTSSV
jgi:hypothetical protein